MRRALTMLTLTVLLVGCNGGESTDTTVIDTSAPDSQPSTSATTTSTTTTSSTTTTVAPTTTVPIEQQIEAAVQKYHDAYWRCVQAPASCDPASFLAEQGTARGILTESLAKFLARSIYVGPDLRGSYMTVESVTMMEPGVASVVSCQYDAGTVLGPPGPDGQPTVVADTIESFRVEQTLYEEGGLWLVGREKRTEDPGSGDLCGG